MDRRKALKNISLTTGFVAVSPMLVEMLQSCNTNEVSWVPSFFTQEEGVVLTALVDIIIPKTDTPSASQVNVPEFIDSYMGVVAYEEQRQEYRDGMKALMKVLKDRFNTDIHKVKEKDYKTILEENFKNLKNKKNKETVIFNFLNALRWATINAYKSSKYIGKEVLAYDPVPGTYIGCDSVDKLSGGKAWSL